MSADTRPLRVDAEERRRRILDAAGRVFVEEGIDVPLDRVAKEAGVGVGTLYRRFPDRTALIIGVIGDSGRTTIEAARTALEGMRAWDALDVLLQHKAQSLFLRPQIAEQPALREALVADPSIRDMREQLFALLEDLVARAQEEGSMRRDVGPGDVALLLGLLGRRPFRTGPQAETNTRRVQALVLDALAAGPCTELPGEPLSVDDLRKP